MSEHIATQLKQEREGNTPSQVRVEWKKDNPDKKGIVSHTVGRIGSLVPNILLGTPKASFQNPRPDLEDYLRGHWDGTYLGKDPVVYANHAPMGKTLKRLFSSDRKVNPVQRVVLGVPSTIIGSVLAGLSRADHYNPYAESSVVYHSHPSVAMHEVGHKEDFANKKVPGVRALAYGLPIVRSVYEWFASRNAMEHLHTKEERQHARKILEPAWGTYVGSDFVVGAVPGAIIGHIHARKSPNNIFFKEKEMTNRPASEKKAA